MAVDDQEPGRSASASVSYSPKHGGRAMDAAVLKFDLKAELEPLLREPSYHDGKPGGRTLIKQSGLRIVLMALKTGARFQEHRASGPVSIQAVQGSLRVRLPDQVLELSAGELLTLESGIRHDLEAVEDSVFLLTIGRTTYEDVSDRHEPGQ